MGYIVARSSSVFTRDGENVPTWEVLAGHANKPSPDDMRQYRASRNSRHRSVRMFTDEQWDDLPFGSRNGDWVTADNYSWPRKD